MREFLKVWISRLVIIALLVYAGKRWGMPLYKQYFTHEIQEAFIPTSQVEEGPFTVSFHEMGTLDAEKSGQVLSPIQGQIIWLVQDGTTVHKGDRICEVDTEPMKTQLDTARLDYESAVSKIGQAKEGIRMYELSRKNDLDKAKADFDFAKDQLDLFNKQLEKKKALAKDKLVAGQEIIQAEMDEKGKEMDLKKREMDLKLLEEQVKSDVLLKRRDVDEANISAETRKAALDDINKKIGEANIFAKDGGLVVLSQQWRGSGERSKLQEGDNLYPNQTICSLPDLSRMRVRVKLGEADAPRVKLGMRALVRLDSIPNRVFHGTVKTIDSLAKADDPWEGGNGQKKIEIVIALKEADPNILKPGMTADVEFISRQIPKSIYVPIECVSEKAGQTFVYVKEGKSYHRLPVKTGIANDNFICIRDGLKKGQTIALRDPTRPLDEQGPSVTETSDRKKQSAPIPEGK